MNKTTSIVSLVILMLVVMSAGAGFGYFLGLQNTPVSQSAPILTNTQTNTALASSLIKFISVLGQVKSVNGNTITVSNNKDTMTVQMKANTSVYQSVAGKTGQQKTTMAAIKVGQTVNISANMLATGKLQGYGIYILPAPKTPAPKTAVK